MSTTKKDSPLILVADDDSSTRMLLRLILENEGYQVAEVENGEQCLAAYRSQRPEMVLLDAMMPVMDGFACCTQLKSLPMGARTPVLMITGLDDQESVERAFEAGAADYVTKPIHPSVLSRRLRRLLEATGAEEALRESEKKYRSVVTNLKEVIFQTDASGRLTFLNSAWTEITGFSLDESLGRSFLQFIHPDDRQLYWEQFQPLIGATASDLISANLASFKLISKYIKPYSQKAQFKANTLKLLKLNYLLLKRCAFSKSLIERQKENCRYQIRYLTKNGGVVQMEVYANLVSDDNDALIGISGILNDITERKRIEQHLRAEHATTRVLAESATLSEATPKILQAICESLGWEHGEFWLMDRQAKVLRCLETRHLPSIVEKQALASLQEFEAVTEQIPFASGVGLPGRIWTSGEPIWIADLVEDGNFPRASIAAKVGMRAAFGFSILGGNERLGVMIFFSRELQQPDADLLKIAAGIGSQIGQFIKRKQAEEELQRQNQILQSELNQAAEYVRSLLSPPLTGAVTIEQQFVPSLQLGGDVFDYYWLDDDNLVIYLLDVAGHGVRSALLSISVLSLLRSQSLPTTNFYQPTAVLKGLNQVFQMNESGDDYFTIWYGVYNRVTRKLVYACAGHPPAILLSQASTATSVKKLSTPNIPIGMLPEADFDEDSCQIQPGSTLYIFSDGVYEISQPDDKIWGLDAFVDLITDYQKSSTSNLEKVLHHIQSLNGNQSLDDDFSLLKITFKL